MIIKKKLRQRRRDFWADYECEHCGHIEKDSSGYDDANFHDNVIPNMKCKECGESSNSKRSDKTVKRKTKYPEHVVI